MIDFLSLPSRVQDDINFRFLRMQDGYLINVYYNMEINLTKYISIYTISSPLLSYYLDTVSNLFIFVPDGFISDLHSILSILDSEGTCYIFDKIIRAKFDENTHI